MGASADKSKEIILITKANPMNKWFLIGLIFSLSSLSFADDQTQKKILELEKRIKQLERSQGSRPSGLKTQDYKNSTVDKKEKGKGLAGHAQEAQLSKEQQEKLMKQIEMIKKNQKEEKKLLDEIMNEE